MQATRFASITFFLASSACAQTLVPHVKPATEPAIGASQLPITRVALYKNGVGFFAEGKEAMLDEQPGGKFG